WHYGGLQKISRRAEDWEMNFQSSFWAKREFATKIGIYCLVSSLLLGCRTTEGIQSLDAAVWKRLSEIRKLAREELRRQNIPASQCKEYGIDYNVDRQIWFVIYGRKENPGPFFIWV